MKKIVTLLAVLLIGQVSNAQELNQMIQESFRYFPRIKELNTSAELNELRVDVVQTNFLPNIGGTASYSYINPVGQKEFPTGPNETQLLRFQPYNNYNLNVGLNQLVWDFGRSKAQIEKAKSDLLVSKQNIEAAKLQLAAQVASIYYSMIYLKKSLIVEDSVIAFYRNNLKIVEGKVKQGDALQLDLSTMQNNIDQEENRKLEFQRQYDRQAALLHYTTGQQTMPGSNELDFLPAATLNLSNNPDLIAASERINAALAEARLADRNKAPSLSLQGGAGFRNGYQPDIEAMRFNYLGGVTLNVPIFQGGRLRQNSAIARKTVALGEFSRSNLSATLQKDMESVQSDLKAFEAQIINSEGQINVSNETQRLTQARYRQGVVTYLELINASNNVQRAYLNKLQYEYQRTLAKVELCRLTGVKFWE